MLYIILRASDHGDENQPHPKSFKKDVVVYQTRTCTEEYFNSRYSSGEGLWKSKGSDHIKTNKGLHIQRKLGTEEKWVIEISDLNKFLDEVGSKGNRALKRKTLW